MILMKYLAVAGLLFALVLPSGAFEFRDNDGGLTLVWVKIKALPGEGRWQACRRVYQRDVYQVRRGRGNTMWCNVEHHRLYDGARQRRNYNIGR